MIRFKMVFKVVPTCLTNLIFIHDTYIRVNSKNFFNAYIFTSFRYFIFYTGYKINVVSFMRVSS